MTRRRSSYPNPRDLARAIDAAIADLRAIPTMYARLHDMTGTSPRVEGVHVRGGGDADPTGELAMPVVVDEGAEPEDMAAIRATETERRRRHAKRVAADVERIARVAGETRDGLAAHVGPTAGFRQPTRVADDGWLTPNDLAESLANQERRLGAGIE